MVQGSKTAKTENTSNAVKGVFYEANLITLSQLAAIIMITGTK